jgi:hypothetical protein
VIESILNTSPHRKGCLLSASEEANFDSSEHLKSASLVLLNTHQFGHNSTFK